MVWFQVDDNLAFHPKVIEAGNGAMGLWVRGGAWCMANLTDGFLPARVAYQLGTKSMCNRLIKVGLFEEAQDGYQFHDWYDRQVTKAEVESRRKSDRIRKADMRKRHLTPVLEPEPDSSGIRKDSERNPNGIHPESAGNPSGIHSPIPFPSIPISRDLGGKSPVGSTNDTPPPQFCIDHPDGTSKPCRACETCRKRYEAWAAANTWDKIKNNPHLTAQDLAKRIDNCPLGCAKLGGYRPNGIVCDHIDRADVAKAGMEMVRAALAQKSESDEVPF